MQLPDNRLLAGLALFVPPFAATAIPLLLLRWDAFFWGVGAASIWFTIQVLWGLYCRGDRDIPYEPESKQKDWFV